MTKKEAWRRSEYFQTIAQHFFRHRGAPFFLSSKDLDLITRWEKMGIPLRVVLEGMRRAFGNYGSKPHKKEKVISLSYCHNQVVKAFEQHRERRVGKGGIASDREKKREMVRTEVKRFLKAHPSEISFLEDVYSQAYELLSRGHLEEDELERLDDEVERLLLENFPEETEGKRPVSDGEGGEGRSDQQLAVWNLKRVKQWREKYRIPYISLFYY